MTLFDYAPPGPEDKCPRHPRCGHGFHWHDQNTTRCTYPGCSCGEAAAAKQEAIQRADDHAAPEWKVAAYEALCHVANTTDEFTADDVWEALGPEAVNTHEPSALGPVFLRASRDKVIVKTGKQVLSRNPRRHRDLTVWRQAR